VFAYTCNTRYTTQIHESQGLLQIHCGSSETFTAESHMKHASCLHAYNGTRRNNAAVVDLTFSVPETRHCTCSA
jgi:hypothetical protein